MKNYRNYIGSLIGKLPRDGVRHFANAHFPGLYSIVLSKRVDRGETLLERAFIAPPNCLHPDLREEHSSFLWHEHGYDFTETTIAGKVTNICVREKPGLKGINYLRYIIKAGIDTGKTPTLEKCGAVTLWEFARHEAPTGCSFSMAADIVHRVLFEPCQKTGWFCSIVKETWKTSTPPIMVYSTHELTTVPNAEHLYKEINTEEALSVLFDLGATFEIEKS